MEVENNVGEKQNIFLGSSAVDDHHLKFLAFFWREGNQRETDRQRDRNEEKVTDRQTDRANVSKSLTENDNVRKWLTNQYCIHFRQFKKQKTFS